MMKLSVGKKLYAGFLVGLVMTVLVGWIGMSRLSSMHDTVTYITTDPLPGVENINKINYLTEHILSTDLKITIEQDPTKDAALNQEAEKVMAETEKALSDYESTITTDEDRKYFNTLKEE